MLFTSIPFSSARTAQTDAKISFLFSITVSGTATDCIACACACLSLTFFFDMSPNTAPLIRHKSTMQIRTKKTVSIPSPAIIKSLKRHYLLFLKKGDLYLFSIKKIVYKFFKIRYPNSSPSNHFNPIMSRCQYKFHQKYF